jgi:uncharacterized membrane protein SpoIIM required for sporulation
VMDLAAFVAQRREAWTAFERRLDEVRRGPGALDHAGLEALTVQYRQILQDHAAVSARHPDSGAAARLRALALSGTRVLHEGGERRRFTASGMWRRFSAEFRRQRQETVVAVILFLAAMLFGGAMAVARPEMGLRLLGPDRIDGLRDGRLWTESLTTTVPPSISSSFIATNNMSVALVAWVGGAVAGIGSLQVCIVNGFMLGAIFGVAHHWSMAGALAEFVAAHGPLELTLILVAAGAGLRVGRALVVAGDRPRSEALRDAATGSVVVLVGCLPWFVVLGLVEGLLSPAPAVSPAFKVVSGFLLLGAFLALAVLGPRESRDDV